MTIEDYKQKANEISFTEFPYVITGHEPSPESFIEFDKTDTDLKIHLTKVIICRCFSPTGGIYWPDNPKWFIKNFLRIYNKEYLKPWIGGAIKEAIEMIGSGDTFVKGIIGTTFMFGIVEYYAKHLLGWRPDLIDFFNKEKHKQFRNMGIGDAINRLKKSNLEVAKSLNEIDKHNVVRLKEMGIAEERWTIARIGDRLTLARNAMLHGENHSFYDHSEYLVLLYILFWLHDYKSELHGNTGLSVQADEARRTK